MLEDAQYRTPARQKYLTSIELPGRLTTMLGSIGLDNEHVMSMPEVVARACIILPGVALTIELDKACQQLKKAYFVAMNRPYGLFIEPRDQPGGQCQYPYYRRIPLEERLRTIAGLKHG